jgi:hydrogenase maturation protease
VEITIRIFNPTSPPLSKGRIKEGFRIMTQVHDILILGIGNILLKDEGVGVHVVRRLKEISLPGNVEVLDGGTAGLDLVDFIANRKKVIVIDAVNAGEKPGTIYHLTEKNLDIKPKALMSFHEIDFLDAIHMSDVMGDKPEEIVVIGVEPKDMSDGVELSPEIEVRIPRIIEVVMAEVNNPSCHSEPFACHSERSEESQRVTVK